MKTTHLRAAGVATLAVATSILVASPAWAATSPIEATAAASVMEAAPGDSVTFTVTNPTADGFDGGADWCGGASDETDANFSMVITFDQTAGGSSAFEFPTGSRNPGANGQGLGHFLWTAGTGETESQTITLPADAVPGKYDVFLGCVTPLDFYGASLDYSHPGDGATIYDFVITGAGFGGGSGPGSGDTSRDPALAATGADAKGMLAAGVTAVIAFGLAGASFLIRRLLARR